MKPENESWQRAVGPGWRTHLVTPFLEAIDACPDAHVWQIKEKFGHLCLYVTGPEWVMNLAHALEEVSAFYCEDCGHINGWWRPNEKEPTCVTTAGPGWIKTLCQNCRQMRATTREGQHAGI